MTDLIKPRTVEYEESVVVEYPFPRTLNYPAEDRYSYRSFTIRELEDVLEHARLHDAEDDTLVNIEPYDRSVKIYLPKNWSDVSKVPVGRYAPVRNRFWSGFICASILCIILGFLVFIGVDSYYRGY